MDLLLGEEPQCLPCDASWRLQLPLRPQAGVQGARQVSEREGDGRFPAGSQICFRLNGAAFQSTGRMHPAATL